MADGQQSHMHIVILTHFYPPLNAIASLRPRSFAKYFAEQGIKVTVITTIKKDADGQLDLSIPQHPNIHVVSLNYTPLFFWKSWFKREDQAVPYQQVSQPSKTNGGIKQWLKNQLDQMGFLLDHQMFWIKKAASALESVHREHPVDAVISSFSPPAVHIAAARVIKKYPTIKWIADYRDLWSQNHILSGKGFYKRLEKWMETRAITYAHGLTTVSDILAEDLCQLVNNKIPVEVIYNGFDTKPQVKEKPETQNRPLRIVYTGTIYKNRRDPSPLFQALNQLKAQGVIAAGDVKVEFYGNAFANLAEIIDLQKASEWVDLKGSLTYAAAIEVQANADLLLFLESNAPDARGVLTGKLFEYIVSGTPILAIGVDEFCATSKVIAETGTGIVLGNDTTKIKDYLSSCLNTNAKHKFKPDMEKINRFSRDQQALKMLQFVKSIV